MVWIESPDPGDFFTKKKPTAPIDVSATKTSGWSRSCSWSFGEVSLVCVFVGALFGSASCDPDQWLKGEFEAVLFLAGVWYIGSSKWRGSKALGLLKGEGFGNFWSANVRWLFSCWIHFYSWPSVGNCWWNQSGQIFLEFLNLNWSAIWRGFPSHHHHLGWVAKMFPHSMVLWRGWSGGRWLMQDFWTINSCSKNFSEILLFVDKTWPSSWYHTLLNHYETMFHFSPNCRESMSCSWTHQQYHYQHQWNFSSRLIKKNLLRKLTYPLKKRWLED